jgi:hypothetical protein
MARRKLVDIPDALSNIKTKLDLLEGEVGGTLMFRRPNVIDFAITEQLGIPNEAAQLRRAAAGRGINNPGQAARTLSRANEAKKLRKALKNEGARLAWLIEDLFQINGQLVNPLPQGKMHDHISQHNELTFRSSRKPRDCGPRKCVGIPTEQRNIPNG